MICYEGKKISTKMFCITRERLNQLKVSITKQTNKKKKKKKKKRTMKDTQAKNI